MPGKKGGGGGGAGGKKPSDGSPARHPPPPSGPPGSSHPAGGASSNTRVSHNTEAVPRDADLGTVGKHGRRRSISNSNCEAVLRDAGLGAVGKHGHRSPTSNLSASPRSSDAGATSTSPSSGGAGATKGSGSPPRSVRGERKARADKLQSLLYPHPDKLADFKSSVGGDLQPHRLFSDVKFRDTWMQFEKNPTGQLRERLQKMAVSLHKRWYEKFSNTTKSKSNCFYSTRSTKCKDHSFDTGNAPTPAAPPEYKIPRKGKSPATPKVAAGSTTPPTAPTFEEGEEIEIAQLPTEEELSKSLGSSLSFADAASSTTTGAKTKVNHEFILFVNKGGKERLGMSMQTWNLFTKKLTELVMTWVFNDLPVPKIDWSNLVRGIGVLAAVDEDSQVLTKQLVSEIEVAEHKFRAWSKNERGIYTSITAKLPAMLRIQPYGKIMAAAVKMNNLPESGYVLRKGMTFKDQGDVRLLRIRATKEFLEALQKVKRVRVGICSLEFRVHGAQE